jgi:hypothetical protein
VLDVYVSCIFGLVLNIYHARYVNKLRPLLNPLVFESLYHLVFARMSKEIDDVASKRVSSDNEQAAASYSSTAPIGRENLSDQVPPHETYEGLHRWDPAATWTPEEEKKLVRKTDYLLLSWLCLMVQHTLHAPQ